MSDLPRVMTCPYCGHEEDDDIPNWDGETEEVTCSHCKSDYRSAAIYTFEGFQIDKTCDTCGEWTDEGMALCDCDGNQDKPKTLRKYDVTFFNRVNSRTETIPLLAENKFKAFEAFYEKYDRGTYEECIMSISETVERRCVRENVTFRATIANKEEER